MFRSKLMRIILVAGSALIIVGVSIMTWMLATEEERNVISVGLVDGMTEALEFEDLALVPGGECEYTIRFEKRSTDEFDVELDFVETEEKTLRDYARVKIVSGSEIIYDELLSTAFEGDPLVLTVDFDTDKNTELDIVYYLPIDVGNEAKNAEAVFELQLSASNE